MKADKVAKKLLLKNLIKREIINCLNEKNVFPSNKSYDGHIAISEVLDELSKGASDITGSFDISYESSTFELTLFQHYAEEERVYMSIKIDKGELNAKE